MFRQLFILLTLILLPYSGSAQEIVSVYFKSGSHKVSSYSVKVIEDKLKSLNYDDISHIACTGYSDSSGNIQSNQRLSERRAKAVEKQCREFLKEEVPLYTHSKGETTQKVDSLSRRVDIIIYHLERPGEQDTTTLSATDERCFGTDEDIYRYLNTKVVSNKQRSSVYIELLNSYPTHQFKHYFIKNPGTSNAIAQRVNWKKQKTGKLWWRETRLTATIPKESFDQFGLVLLLEQPCSGCPESIYKQDTNLVVSKKYVTNYFLESVTQIKTKFFRHNQAEIRIPREYVDSSIGVKVRLYTLANEEKNLPVQWEQGKKKKSEDYYFFKFNSKYYDYFEILSQQPQWECPAPIKVDTSNGWFRCGLRCRRTGSDYLYLRTTVSAFYHNDTLTSYFAIRPGFRGQKSELQAEIGLNHRLGFYGALSYRFHYMEISLMNNRGLDPWQKLSEAKFSRYLTPYVGLELRTSYTKKYKSFAEINLHTGFSMNYTNRFGYYIQGGIARDLSNTINTRFYPYIQAGITYTFEFRLN